MHSLFLAEKDGVNLDDLLGKEINLPAKTSIGNEKVVANQKICGIYSTKYANFIIPSQKFYTSYLPYNEDYISDIDSQKEIYDSNLNHLKTLNNETREYLKDIYSNFENYQKALGTGYKQMIIIMDKPNDVKQITEELNKLFPVYVKFSQYDTKKWRNFFNL